MILFFKSLSCGIFWSCFLNCWSSLVFSRQPLTSQPMTTLTTWVNSPSTAFSWKNLMISLSDVASEGRPDTCTAKSQGMEVSMSTSASRCIWCWFIPTITSTIVNTQSRYIHGMKLYFSWLGPRFPGVNQMCHVKGKSTLRFVELKAKSPRSAQSRAITASSCGQCSVERTLPPKFLVAYAELLVMSTRHVSGSAKHQLVQHHFPFCSGDFRGSLHQSRSQIPHLVPYTDSSNSESILEKTPREVLAAPKHSHPLGFSYSSNQPALSQLCHHHSSNDFAPSYFTMTGMENSTTIESKAIKYLKK
mmetsp:Transcript_110361/g.285296  ORF Transcript_110361/g.285296 Transcript_110361/m.285296 type:complete len:304 (+) Transcript_110361:358-1269(+)